MKHLQGLRQFNRRAILSGNVLEIYEYEQPVFKGTAKKRHGRSNSPFTSDSIKADNRAKIAKRAKATVRRTVNANPHLNKFLTLTFAENITDLDFARYEFDKFIKRLKTRFQSLQFINVIEFQKRGAIHFHLLCNLPYINAQELAQVWTHGFIRINRIDNVDNVGAYVTKYMTKDNLDERLIGRKCYTMSKGLNKPTEYTKEKEVDEILDNLENVKRVYTTEFNSEYYGVIKYTQIVCTAPPKKPRKKLPLPLHAYFKRLSDDFPCPFPIRGIGETPL